MANKTVSLNALIFCEILVYVGVHIAVLYCIPDVEACCCMESACVLDQSEEQFLCLSVQFIPVFGFLQHRHAVASVCLKYPPLIQSFQDSQTIL